MASQSTLSDAYVLGVGLTKFLKPRRTREYPELGYEACVKALTDAQVNYDEVQTGIGCYAYGDTTSTQRILYQLGMTGVYTIASMISAIKRSTNTPRYSNV